MSPPRQARLEQALASMAVRLTSSPQLVA